jgi:hypothetical protein
MDFMDKKGRKSVQRFSEDEGALQDFKSIRAPPKCIRFDDD